MPLHNTQHELSLNYRIRCFKVIPSVLLGLLLIGCSDTLEETTDENAVDLSIVDAQFSSPTDEYIVDTLYNLTFKIENDGDLDYFGVPYEVRSDGSTIAEGTVDINANDTTVEQSISIIFTSASSSTSLSLIVDPDDLIEEDIESNNTITFVITVLGAPTLKIAN